MKESLPRSKVLINAFRWRRSTFTQRVEPMLAPNYDKESPQAIRLEVRGWHGGIAPY